MPRVCSICGHAEHKRIDAMIVEAVPNRRIAAQFDVSESAVRRHKARHLPRFEVQAATDARAFDHHRKLKILEKVLFSVLHSRLKDEDHGMVLKVHSSLLRHYGFELQLSEVEELRKDLEEIRELIREREDSR